MKCTSTPPPTMKLTGMFSALKYPNFRLWFGGILSAQTAVWMQNMILSYLVYELTESPVYLGFAGFALGLPSLFLMLYGGAIADRVERRLLLIITQSWFLLATLGMTFLLFTQSLVPWQILLFSLLIGVGVAFNGPASQAFVVDLVEPADLTNAVALHSSLLNGATMIGPALAGVLYALIGVEWCILISGLGFLAAIVTMLMMKMKAARPTLKDHTVLQDLMDGLRYIRTEKAIRLLLFIFALYCICEVFICILMPAWAVNVLGGDVKTNGLLLTTRGTGALLGSLLVAALSRRKIKGKLLSWAMLILPWILLAFALLRWLPLSLFVLCLEGAGFIVFATTINAMLQERVKEEMRARVMSVYTLILMGGMPIGSLVSGALAEVLGEPATLGIAAFLLLGLAVWWWMRWPEMRQMN